MHKVFPKMQGLGHDIHSLQCEDSPNNHWIYEDSNLTTGTLGLLNRFVKLYDGVHVQISDRTMIGREFVNSRTYDREGSDIVSDYSPVHYHHNWRFSDVGKPKEKMVAEGRTN